MLPGLLFIFPSHKSIIFEKRIRLTLYTCRKSERVFKTMINWSVTKPLTQIRIIKTICNGPIPFQKCGTKMAFTEERRGIARSPEDISNRLLIRYYLASREMIPCATRIASAIDMIAGEECISCWRTNRCGRVGVCKHNSLF